MIIRKLFRAENSHVVRNCTSERCKGTINGVGEGGIHGHSYVFQVFLSVLPKNGKIFDNAGMLADFALFKTGIKDFIDSHDHSYTLWDKEPQEYKDFIHKYSARTITTPVSPSAEQMALYSLFIIDKIITATEFNNGEANIFVDSVIVEETITGYAKADRDDLQYCKYNLYDFTFSEAIRKDWSDPDMWNKLINYHSGSYDKPFINKEVKQQIL